MAEMYKEIHAEYRLVESEQGAQGTRVFLRDDVNGDVAAASLPAVGSALMVDPAGTNVANCFLRNREATFVNGHGTTAAWRCHYNTEDAALSSSGNKVPVDNSAEDFEIGAQSESFTPDPNVADGDYWEWGSSVVVEQDLSRIVPHGQFTIPFPQTISSALRDALVTRLNTYVGSINDAAFKGYATGQVMFVGATGGSFRDASGNLMFRVSLRFETRILRTDLKGTAITQDDWLHALSDTHGQYKMPRTNITTKYLYEKKDFSATGLLDTVS